VSRTPGNPPVPVTSSASIVCAYNDHAVRRGSVRAYGRHTPGAEYLPFDNVEGRNRRAGAALTHGASRAGDPLTEEAHYLVWMASVSWDGIRGTDRHMVTAMTCHARILWVDPPVSPVTEALRRSPTHYSLRPEISSVSQQVTRLTPKAMPGLSRPGMRMTTAALVRLQIRWALRRLGIQPFAVVTTYPGDLLGYWGGNVVNVFYGTDDYVAGAALMGLSAHYQLRQEIEVVGRADVVAAVSPQLAERWAGFGARPVVIPNGCWPIKVGERAALPELKDLPQPVVGLIGQLSDRIDLSVLNAIADAGFSLLIVGPLDPRWEQQRFKELVNRSHVYYTGPVPAEAVPSYLAAIDIGITPYQDTPFNRASFPLKTLEYLGAGVPVVSTDIPAAHWLRADLTHGEQARWADRIMVLASSSADFVNAIRRIAASDSPAAAGAGFPRVAIKDPARASQCIAFAARHTWERRANSFASVIGLPQQASGQSGDLRCRL
jgi:teichuronic acid biosynthesis glycosyltransferase TuaH